MRFLCLKCKTINRSAWGDVLKKIRKNKGDKTVCKKCHDLKLTTWSVPLIKKELIKLKIPMVLLSTKYKTNKTPLRWKCKKCSCHWRNGWKSVLLSNQR